MVEFQGLALSCEPRLGASNLNFGVQPQPENMLHAEVLDS